MPKSKVHLCPRCKIVPTPRGYCAACLRIVNRLSYEKNRAKRIAKATEVNRLNPKRAAQQTRKWAKNNPDKVRAIDRRYARRHRERVKVKSSRRRARLRGNGGSHTVAEWQAILDHFGHKCLRCGGTTDIEKDHIKPVARGGTDDASNLQPLCRKCNNWKRAKQIDYRLPGGLG